MIYYAVKYENGMYKGVYNDTFELRDASLYKAPKWAERNLTDLEKKIGFKIVKIEMEEVK